MAKGVVRGQSAKGAIKPGDIIVGSQLNKLQDVQDSQYHDLKDADNVYSQGATAIFHGYGGCTDYDENGDFYFAALVQPGNYVVIMKRNINDPNANVPVTGSVAFSDSNDFSRALKRSKTKIWFRSSGFTSVNGQLKIVELDCENATITERIITITGNINGKVFGDGNGLSYNCDVFELVDQFNDVNHYIPVKEYTTNDMYFMELDIDNLTCTVLPAVFDYSTTGHDDVMQDNTASYQVRKYSEGDTDYLLFVACYSKYSQRSVSLEVYNFDTGAIVSSYLDKENSRNYSHSGETINYDEGILILDDRVLVGMGDTDEDAYLNEYHILSTLSTNRYRITGNSNGYNGVSACISDMRLYGDLIFMAVSNYSSSWIKYYTMPIDMAKAAARYLHNGYSYGIANFGSDYSYENKKSHFLMAEDHSNMTFLNSISSQCQHKMIATHSKYELL